MLLEEGKGAIITVDGLSQRASGEIVGAGGHAVPIDIMVINAAAVVLHRSADLKGQAFDMGQQFFQIPGLVMGIACQSLIELVDIILMMVFVMDADRIRIDIRLQSIVGIWLSLIHI